MFRKTKTHLTDEDVEKFKKWLETATPEDLSHQVVSDEEREEILAGVRKLREISREELDRKCRIAA